MVQFIMFRTFPYDSTPPSPNPTRNSELIPLPMFSSSSPSFMSYASSPYFAPSIAPSIAQDILSNENEILRKALDARDRSLEEKEKKIEEQETELTNVTNLNKLFQISIAKLNDTKDVLSQTNTDLINKISMLEQQNLLLQQQIINNSVNPVLVPQAAAASEFDLITYQANEQRILQLNNLSNRIQACSVRLINGLTAKYQTPSVETSSISTTSTTSTPSAFKEPQGSAKKRPRTEDPKLSGFDALRFIASQKSPPKDKGKEIDDEFEQVSTSSNTHRG